MALKMVWDDGLFCPQVFCDHCGERIERAEAGNYQWPWREDDDRPVFFTHKRCCHAFEQANPLDQGIWCAEQLTALPTYLERNLAMTAKTRRPSKTMVVGAAI